MHFRKLHALSPLSATGLVLYLLEGICNVVGAIDLIYSFQCKQSAEQTSKRLQSLQTQLQDLQAKQAQEVVQRAVVAPKVEENPPVQAEQAGNLQDTFSEG